MPTISIITPAYNCEKYLEEAVDSVLAQTLQDWEMLIIDDCSSDNTYRCMQKLAQKIIESGFSETSIMQVLQLHGIMESKKQKVSGLHFWTVMICGEKKNWKNKWLFWINILRPLFCLQDQHLLKMME